MEIGQKFYQYTIEGILGESNVSQVFVAKHHLVDKKVAIKAIKPAFANQENVRKRLRQEVALLAKLQHPYIALLHDYIEDESGVYLITEYIEGKTLDEYLRNTSKGAMAEQKAVSLFMKILEGVGHAHHQNILHRDLKPAHIFITPNDEVKIIDFGIAKIFKENISNDEKVENIFYMSPEQIKGQVLDRRSDIYALGVILYQMTTGKNPYQNVLTAYELSTKIVNERLPLPRSIGTSISERVENVIYKATLKEIYQRFQTCEDFKKALLGSEFLTAETYTTKRSRGFAWLWGILGIFIVLSVIFVIAQLSDGDAENPTATTPLADTTKNNLSPISQGEEVPPAVVNLTDSLKKEKTPEEILADSLIQVEKLKEEEEKKKVEEHRKKLLDGILVDGQFVRSRSGEFIIKVELVNKWKEVEFVDVIVQVSYYDAEDKLIETYDYKYGILKKDQSDSFEIKRKIPAARFNCNLKKATPIELDAIKRDSSRVR